MPVSPADMAWVAGLVRRRAGIVLEDAQDYLVETRLQPVARARGLASVNHLVAEARKPGAALDTAIVEAITTHETSFFREPAHFDALATDVLPRLLAARGPGRALTLWSAACSSGQEPYSLAMLLLERLGADLAGRRVRILATDLSEQVLARAREATFTQLEVNRGLPAALLVKYFTRDATRWRLAEEPRRLVEFRQLNLVQAWQLPARPDIVLLRNVLIYFDALTRRGVLERVRESIAPDGALFLSSAEQTPQVADGWERVVLPRASYNRVAR